MRRAFGLPVPLCSISLNRVGPLRQVLEENTPRVSAGHRELAEGCAGNPAKSKQHVREETFSIYSIENLPVEFAVIQSVAS